MLQPTASRFWQTALQSGLVDEAALRECWDAIPRGKRVAAHIDRRLARQALQNGLVTLWQAQQLLAGRSGGFKIDRYLLLELVGQGGMGRVYLARDTRLNRRVAVKILSPERVDNPRAIARFHREAMVGAQLQHEHLVRIYDEGEADGRCYLVMEYIEGKTVGQMIAEGGPIPPRIAARLALQVALGLEHAQRKGLIHRDVNPYNILVTRDGTAKLADMGLAIDLAESDRVTRDGATVGTFDYVSPEQARHSHAVDTRSDIYSLGCTLYHMLTGRVPFPTPSLPEKLLGHQASEPEAISALVGDVPEGLSAVVARAMRKTPEGRYATPLELSQALEPYTGEPDVRRAEITPPSLSSWDGGATGSAEPDAPSPTASVTAVTASAAAAFPRPAAMAAPVPPARPAAMPSSTAVSPDPLLGANGLDLALDLGPEAPLSRDARARRGAGSKAGAWPAAGGAGPAAGAMAARPRWLVPAVAVAAGVSALAIGALALSYGVDGSGAGGITSPPRRPDLNVTPSRGTGPAEAPPGGRDTSGPGWTRAPPPATDSRPPREVVVTTPDGTVAYPDLAAAIRAAIGGRGKVRLYNRQPIKVGAAVSATPLSGGPLKIIAGQGARPVIVVEVKGGTPFLTTSSKTALTIRGVEIVAPYLNPPGGDAPLIRAGGDVTIDRCAFRVEGKAVVPFSQAVAVEGGTLTARGCWFENFDRALDLASFAGSTATLTQCMLVQTFPGAPTAAGWAVRLRGMLGTAKKARRLAVDHCTVVGAGFLDLNGFSAAAPLKVEPTACAVLADAMIGWGPGPEPPRPAALQWSGRENLYDVRGRPWVRRPGAAGDGPADLDAWARQIGNEANPGRPPVKFAVDPSALSEHPGPYDFAVVNQARTAAGADPARVGPGGR